MFRITDTLGLDLWCLTPLSTIFRFALQIRFRMHTPNRLYNFLVSWKRGYRWERRKIKERSIMHTTIMLNIFIGMGRAISILVHLSADAFW